MRRRDPFAIGTILALAAGLALAPALSASADQSTTIEFTGAASVDAEYGGDWVIPLTVSDAALQYGVASNAGTVDVFVSGVAGPYASGLPLFPSGRAFFAQPSSRDPLAAGSYEVTAVFQPATGSGLASSQTLSPITLSISPLALTAQVTEVPDSAVATGVDVELSLSGAFVDTLGRAPEGSWSVKAESGGVAAFEGSVVQTASLTPIAVKLTGLDAETDYTVTAAFTPSEASAGGIELTGSDPVTVTTSDRIRPPWYEVGVDAPSWALGSGAALLVLLLAAAVVLAAALTAERRRGRVGSPAIVDDPSPDSVDA